MVRTPHYSMYIGNCCPQFPIYCLNGWNPFRYTAVKFSLQEILLQLYQKRGKPTLNTTDWSFQDQL